MCPLFVLVLFSVLHCSRSDHPAPFFNGMYLEFKDPNNIQGSVPRIIYKLNSIDNASFKMSVDSYYSSGTSDNREFVVSRYGILSGNFIGKISGSIKGVYSNVWIPMHNITVGKNLGEGFSIEKIENWYGWKVYVVGNNMQPSKEYYEIQSGLLVGFGGPVGTDRVEFILVDTNANLSVYSGQKANSLQE